MSRLIKLVLVLAALAMLLSACTKKPKERLYFDDLRPPVGSGKVSVVEDISKNLPGGGEISVLVKVEPDIDKDELNVLLKSFYRQVKGRRGFQAGDKAQSIDIRVYADLQKIKIGGDEYLGRVHRGASNEEPAYENKQKAPLLKWAKKALGKMPQYVGKIQPQILADAETMSLEVTLPFVEHDGKGQYVEKLTYARFTSDWSSTTYDVFSKLEGLQKFTFIGTHNDKVMAKITMTRDQFDAMQMKDILEKELSAFQGQFVSELLSGNITEKKVEQKVDKQRHIVYRKLFAMLPPEQVELDKSLR